MRIIRFISTTFLLVLAFVISSFTTPEKQMNKLVTKMWKGQEVMLSQIELPDSILIEIPFFVKIEINNELVGYSCFSTAFGCRIGGCSSPGVPNTDSFETFDYIVIYDTNLSILKVDIANYSGAYGYEICRAKWLKQFIGGTSEFKLNENVDGISGATVSASYLIDDINSMGKIVRSLKDDSII